MATKFEQATEIFRACLPVLREHGKKTFTQLVKNKLQSELDMTEASAATHCSNVKKFLIDAGEVDPSDWGTTTKTAKGATMNLTSEVPNIELPPIPTGGMSAVEAEYRELETEDEAIARIAENFDILDHMTRKCAEGAIRGMICISGPGVGKTHTVTNALEEVYDPDDRHQFNGNAPFDIIKGSVSAPAMYIALYQCAEEGQVLVLDDADVWGDEEALNLLKAALDDKKIRQLAWRKQSRWLEDYDIPDNFIFKGSVIFLSNIDPANTRSEKMRRHIEALASRCMMLDIDITSRSDRLLRIKQVMGCGLLADFNLTAAEERLIYDFVESNFDDLKEQSLRIVRNIADLYITGGVTDDDDSWEVVARKFVLNTEAYYRWRLALKKDEAEG